MLMVDATGKGSMAAQTPVYIAWRVDGVANPLRLCDGLGSSPDGATATLSAVRRSAPTQTDQPDASADLLERRATMRWGRYRRLLPDRRPEARTPHIVASGNVHLPVHPMLMPDDAMGLVLRLGPALAPPTPTPWPQCRA